MPTRTDAAPVDRGRAGTDPASAPRAGRLLRRIDPGWGLLLLLCLLAAWPLLSRSGLPRETDAELHIFRLAELARLVAGGEIYPRWAPNFYFGYGYPIFNYYAPLVYYLGLVPMALGTSAVFAVKVWFVAGLWLGAAGTYGFVRPAWGRPAGLVAATAFLFAPYVLFVDPHARGDLAESFALGLLPVAFWALDAFRRRPGAVRWLAAVGAVAAVVLAHNLMAMVTFALLAGWVGWGLFAGWRRGDAARRTWVGPLAALLAGVGLSAFFWLPVALEQEAVNLSNLIGDGGHFDFRNHFLSLGELLAPSLRLDWGATEPAYRLNLGTAQWLLALLGLAALARRRLRTAGGGPTGYFPVVALLLVALMLPLAEPAWETVPLLPFLQFPWRLLGPTAFFLAVPAGWAAAGWLDEGRRGGGLALALAALLLPALPLLAVPPWPADFGETGTRALIEMEYRGRWLGTTSTADFVPATVAVVPGANERMRAALLAETEVDRVNRATLPAGAVVRAEPVRPLRTRYQVESPEPFLLRLFLFAFPGWEARVDGVRVETEVGLPEGFLVVPVPAGAHEVDVRFAGTPARRVATALAVFSLAAALVAAPIVSRSQSGRPALPALAARPAAAASWRGLLPGFLVTAAIAILATTWLLPAGLLHWQSTGLTALPARTSLYRGFGDGEIALIGMTVTPAAAIEPGGTLSLTLYWKALRDLDENYQVFVHLLDDRGVIRAQGDKLNPGDFPSRRWPGDRYVRDAYRLALPNDLTPGAYRLVTGLWRREENRRLAVVDDAGRALGDVAELTELRVEP